MPRNANALLWVDRWVICFAVAITLLVVGCGKPRPREDRASRNILAPQYVGAPGVERFIVCAPNLVLSLPSELLGARAPLQYEIESYLVRHGRKVGRLHLYDGRLLWHEAIAQAKQAGELENALVYFAASLAEQFDFQAIAMPSIVLHETPTTYSWAS